MKKGSEVKIIQPVLTGTIKRVVWDEERDMKRFLVDFSDGEGNISEKWLTENQVEAV